MELDGAPSAHASQDFWNEDKDGKDESAFYQAFGAATIPLDAGAVRTGEETFSDSVTSSLGSSVSDPFAEQLDQTETKFNVELGGLDISDSENATKD